MVNHGRKPQGIEHPKTQCGSEQADNRRKHQAGVARRMIAPGYSSDSLLPEPEADDERDQQQGQEQGRHPRPPKALLLAKEHMRICKCVHIIANCNYYITICNQVNRILNNVFNDLEASGAGMSSTITNYAIPQ